MEAVHVVAALLQLAHGIQCRYGKRWMRDTGCVHREVSALVSIGAML